MAWIIEYLLFTFRYHLSCHLRPAHFDCSWDNSDDTNLLLGIYEYGMGSWEAIKMDPVFKLHDKVGGIEYLKHCTQTHSHEKVNLRGSMTWTLLDVADETAALKTPTKWNLNTWLLQRTELKGALIDYESIKSLRCNDKTLEKPLSFFT